MQAAQQWIEEHQGQLRDGGDAAESQGNPSEDDFFLFIFCVVFQLQFIATGSNMKQRFRMVPLVNVVLSDVACCMPFPG